jgi:hypothetical protein
MNVSLINLEDTDLYWNKTTHFLDAALKYTNGRYEVDDIYQRVIRGTFSFWVVFNNENIVGTIITSVNKYPRKKVLCIQFCGGERFKDWLEPMALEMRKHAKENDCQGIEATGRVGWAKMLEKEGYKLLWCTFEVNL